MVNLVNDATHFIMRPSPRAARVRAEVDDADVSSPGFPLDDEEVRSDFFSTFDPNAFLAELEAYTQHTLPSPAPVDTVQPLNTSNDHIYAHMPQPEVQQPEPQQHTAPANTPAAHQANSQSDFFATAIQILTHILGSSRPYPWIAPDTPAVDGIQSQPAGSPSYEPDLQRLINTLIERLGGSTAPAGGVREQDLTRLLHTLMEQQQQQQQQKQQQVPGTSYPKPRETTQTRFAELNLPEEEDDDDPDFLPLPSDTPQETMPSDSAWTRAMHEVIGLPMQRTSTAPVSPVLLPPSPAKATRLQKRLQAELDVPKARPGRTKIYTEEEAAERKRARNRTYAKKQRQKLRRQRLGLPSDEDEESGDIDANRIPPRSFTVPAVDPGHSSPPEPAPRGPSDELVIAAENRFLRAEVERLREENARLRGREEMRAYVARMRAGGGTPNLYM